MRTIPQSEGALTAAVQYDVSMALHALKKASSRLPPEIASDPFVTALGTFFGTLHQDFRSAIFTIEQIRDRIALEGIAGRCLDTQQESAGHEGSTFEDVGWTLPSEITAPQTLGSESPWHYATPEGGTPKGSGPLAGMKSFEGLKMSKDQAVPSQQNTDPQSSPHAALSDKQYRILSPAETQYAKLPSPDRYVAQHLWLQLEPFICNGKVQDLWEIGTEKLAELRTQANGRGAWSDHVVRETATWRCFKVWQAIRIELLKQTTTSSWQEQLNAVNKVLAALGQKN